MRAGSVRNAESPLQFTGEYVAQGLNLFAGDRHTLALLGYCYFERRRALKHMPMRRRVNRRWTSTVKIKPERPLYNHLTGIATVDDYVHLRGLAGDLSIRR